ncbi:MAG: tRNA epoxyqueuosine(34) reductase QueG [Prevotella sp.]|jgi:epoxyqueuosine reductase|nr:tRNA epoxyqueuosine(34) reductase QueG [Prevotella sp.]
MITSRQIKDYAFSLGFDACGICQAGEVDHGTQQSYEAWLGNSYNGSMDYMERNVDKRYNPALLVENARSVICIAINYYPSVKQPVVNPQFAYYAYGKDYHDVVKKKLYALLDYIKASEPKANGRVFVDSAPVLEHYWAAKAGIGFVGKNSLLIVPKKGSFLFLGELIVDMELEYDSPITTSCGNCTRCMQECPTQAIVEPGVVDSRNCISYQTIENKGSIDGGVMPYLTNYIYGCDICQKACPWNRYAEPHQTEEFDPSRAFLDLSSENLENMTEEGFKSVFRGSAVKRIKYTGLKRNFEAWKQNK